MKTNILQAKKALLALFAMLLPLVTNAQTKVEIDGIWYNLVAKAKQAEVTSSDGTEYSGSITLPATVTHDGVEYSVTSIEDDAFSFCSLISITIPEGVTSIGDYAFRDCSSLTAITLPEGVTSIGKLAFSGCSSLTAITIPEGVTSIGRDAFAYCSSLTAITIPESVTSIGNRAFFDCSSLTAITLPESVTSIGNYAFYGCSKLTAINIPESVTSIGGYAFSGCSSLTTIALPKNLKDIYSQAFANCPELTDVYCYAETVPSTKADAFDGSYPEYATLHVPAGAINSYKATAPWSSFGTIKAIENVILEKCATPTINYKDGKVVFACDTEGAIVKSNIKENIAGDYNEMEVAFMPTYTITAYATKENYEDSDAVNLTICWIPCDENHDETTGILTIPSKPVLISARDGVLTLSGLPEDTTVTLYTTDGAMVAQQQSNAGEARFTVDTNQVYIVTVADKVVKIGL